MEIKTYFGEYDDEIISLILDIQNKESKINLSLQEQPDLLDIRHAYQDKGGQFWVALSQGKVIGTIALMMKEDLPVPYTYPDRNCDLYMLDL